MYVRRSPLVAVAVFHAENGTFSWSLLPRTRRCVCSVFLFFFLSILTLPKGPSLRHPYSRLLPRLRPRRSRLGRLARPLRCRLTHTRLLCRCRSLVVGRHGIRNDSLLVIRSARMGPVVDDTQQPWSIARQHHHLFLLPARGSPIANWQAGRGGVRSARSVWGGRRGRVVWRGPCVLTSSKNRTGERKNM